MSYDDNATHIALAKIRTYGDPAPVSKCTSQSKGAQTSYTRKERDAKIKTEAGTRKTLDAARALAADRSAFHSDSEWGEAAKLYLEARFADARAGTELLAAIEANAAAIEGDTDVVEEEQLAAALELLDQARECLHRVGDARTMRGAIRDRNPLGLLSPISKSDTPKIPGGKLLTQLIATLTNLDRPTVVYVAPAEMAKLQHGQPGVDIDGNAVPALTGRVRVAYGAQWDGGGSAARGAFS